VHHVLIESIRPNGSYCLNEKCSKGAENSLRFRVGYSEDRSVESIEDKILVYGPSRSSKTSGKMPDRLVG